MGIKNKFFLFAITLSIAIFLCGCKNNAQPEKTETFYAESVVYVDGKEFYRMKTLRSEEITELTEQEESAVYIADNWFVDSLAGQLISDISKKDGLSKDKAIEYVFNKGLRIHATVNLEIQKMLEDSFDDSTLFSTRQGYAFAQSAMVIMDYDGHIIASVGGNNGDRTLNRAVRQKRPPGSAIKPLSVYSQAVSDNSLHFSSLIPDQSIIIHKNGVPTLWPNNHDNKTDPDVTLSKALRESKNTCAVQIAQRYDSKSVLSFLKNQLGFTTLVENEAANDLNLAAFALGSLTKGTYLHELTAAYQIFGNGGFYNRPVMYTRVEAYDGKLLLENNPEKKQVIDSQSSGVLNRLLINTVEFKGATGTAARLDGTEVFGKTGTTSEKHFIGGTPEYLAGVFIGIDGDGDVGNSYSNAPAAIWREIMKKIPLTKNNFDIDPSLVTKDFCTISGKLAQKDCRSVEKGYYKPSNLLEVCTKCKS